MPLQKTETELAGEIGARIVAEINGAFAQANNIIAHGVPANPAAGTPAVTAADIQAAIGTAALAKIAAATAALA